MRVLRSALAFIAALALATTVPTEEARATEIGSSNPFGLGVALGYPAGISGKYYIGGRKNAIEGVIGSWANHWAGAWYLHGVYLWHPSVLTDQPGFELPWHVGLGGFLADDYYGWGRYWANDVTGGVRGQLGLDLDLKDVRLQFSGDLAMNIAIAPEIYWNLHPSITIRYFF